MIISTLKKLSKRLVLFIVLSNLPPVYNILEFFFGSIIPLPFAYITKDYQFCQAGDKSDVLSSKSYQRYREEFPGKDHTLYRFHPERNYKKFWRYGAYLFSRDWRTPYIEVPTEVGVHYYGCPDELTWRKVSADGKP